MQKLAHILFFLFSSLLGLAQHFPFVHFGMEEGLPSNEVYQTLQDSKGFLWFATDRGLVRFDGRKLDVITNGVGLINPCVLRIREDNQGTIWFCTTSNEIYKYNNYKITPLSKKVQSQLSIDKNIVIDFDFSLNDTLIFTTFGFQHKIRDSTIITHKLPQHNLIELDNLSKTRSVFIRPKLTRHNGFSINGKSLLTSTFESGSLFFHKLKSTTWVGTHESLFKIVNNSVSLEIKFPNDRIIAVYQDRNNALWISLKNEGLLRYKNYNNLVNPERFFQGKTISSILQDEEGNTWFSTLSDGILMSPNTKILNYSSELPFKEINASIEINNNIFLAGRNGSIYRINQSAIDAVSFSYFRGTGDVEVMLQRDSASFYFGTSEFFGVMNVDLNYQLISQKNKSAIKDMKSISLTEKGLLLGTSNYLYSSVNNEFLRLGANLKSNTVHFCKGEIYFGNFTGFYRFNKNGIDTLLTVRTDDVVSMNDTLFCATQGDGIVMITGSQKSVSFIKSKHTSTMINCLTINNGFLWAGTNEGVVGYSLKQLRKGEQLQPVIFTKDDGLPSNFIHHISFTKEKNCIVSTKEGISIVCDADLKARLNTPRLFLKNISINDSVVKPNNNYIIPYNSKHINFNFDWISFRGGKQGLLQYKINGLFEWTNVAGNQVNFPTLPHGKYELEVRAINKNNEPSPILTIPFLVSTPWFLNWWGLLIIGLVALLFLGMFFYWQLQKIKGRLSLKNKVLEYQQQALRAQMNPHFIFNTLNSINYFMLNNESDAASKYLLKFGKLIRSILNSSVDQFIPLEEEIQLNTLYLELEKLRLKNKFVFKVECNNLLNIDEFEIPSMIIQPYIENAVIHGISSFETGGQVFLRFTKKSNEKILVEIEDNGVGIRNSLTKREHKSVALDNTKNRITALSELYKENFSVELINKDTGGTLVKIVLPIKLKFD